MDREKDNESAPTLEQDAASLPPPYYQYNVMLTYHEGVFKLEWSGYGIAPEDYVGVFRSDDAPDSDYLSSGWQYANKANSYVTSIPVEPGYQARYLVKPAGSTAWSSVVRTDPFPAIAIGSE